jgi:hypothetical protein
MEVKHGDTSKHGDSEPTDERGVRTGSLNGESEPRLRTGSRNRDFPNTRSTNLQMDGESERGLSEHGESEPSNERRVPKTWSLNIQMNGEFRKVGV